MNHYARNRFLDEFRDQNNTLMVAPNEPSISCTPEPVNIPENEREMYAQVIDMISSHANDQPAEPNRYVDFDFNFALNFEKYIDLDPNWLDRTKKEYESPK